MKWSNLLISIMSFLFIVSLSVVVTLNFRPLYYFDIEYLEIPASSGMDTAEIQANYDALIDYNCFLNKGELEFPSLPQSESGRIHFEEVKAIFVLFQYMAIVLFFVLVPIVVFHAWHHDFLFLKYTSIITLVVPTILGCAMALYWDKVFVLFHKIAFNNDYWIFDPSTDPVIGILPDAFFMHCAIMIIGLVLFMGIGSFAVYKKLHVPKKSAKKIKKNTSKK